MPYVDTYADITFHFIVGRDMFEKDFFDAWSYTIQDPETADINYVDEYSTTVSVYQMDEYDNFTYGATLFQCWPVAIGGMTLDANEFNSYGVLPVTFTYRKWINEKANSGTPTSINSRSNSPVGFRSTIKAPGDK